MKTWTDVDRYLCERLIANDEALEAALEENARAGLPAHDVAPNQGKMLYLLALLCKARRILEIGTLGGYSTIWLARALPADGLLVTLELEAKHREVARTNLTRAGLMHLVEMRGGPAVDSLERLHAEGVEPFDLIFIDADKPNNTAYLSRSLELSHVGTLIVCDNVIREGAIVDAESSDARVQGVRSMFEMMSQEPRLDATALQTVGSKGYDGFAMALVVG